MRSLNSRRTATNTNRPMRVRTPRGSTTVVTDEASTAATTTRPATNATTAPTVPACTAQSIGWRNKHRYCYLYMAKGRCGMAAALVTGGSRGLGRALTRGLIDRGWAVVIDARTAEDLAGVAGPGVVTVAGDVADADHRRRLVEAAAALGGLDLLVNNASVLGPSPQPRLAEYPLGELRRVYEVNTVAPLGLVQVALPLLRRSPDGRIVNVTSDAAVEAYDGWGGYGSSKAALDQLSAVLAVEEDGVARVGRGPGRPPHPPAPGGLPGRGHLRPAGARNRGARPARPDRVGPPERPGATGRPGGGGGMTGALPFALPPELEATAPPEERGLRRDGVRLLVAHRRDGRLDHRHFTDLPAVLEAGDVLAVNRSATLPASLAGTTGAGLPAELHLSSRLPAGLWVVELRHPGAPASTPWLDAAPGTVVHLPAGGGAELLVPAGGSLQPGHPVRLWVAALDLPSELLSYLARHGRPIRYHYVDHDRPIGAYQTVFADEPGSAEMPSAARPFSAELVTRLVARGVTFAPFVLHAGVSSPEAHEPPMAEWYRVPAESAASVNAARRAGHRVIAVGTTAVRALETVADERGRVHAGEGWTEVVVTPERGVTAVDGIDDRLARAAGVAPGHAPGDRRARPARRVVPCRSGGGLPVARVRRQPPDPAVSGASAPERRRAASAVSTKSVSPRPSEPVELAPSEQAGLAVALDALPPGRRAVLSTLKTRGEASAEDVAAVLGVTVSAVRQHLAPLEQHGLVAHRDERPGPGRPRRRYCLTPAAESLWPKRYGQLTNQLLTFLDDADPTLVDQAFEHRRQVRVRTRPHASRGTDVRRPGARARRRARRRRLPRGL